MNVSWFLFKKTVKQSTGRLALTATAIAVGFSLILMFAAAVNAITARQSYSVWRGFTQTKVEGVEPLLVELISRGNLYKWQNVTIDTTSLRATGESSPQIPELPTPQEGEYYVSQGLLTLMQENPDENIGTRFGTKNIGIIPDKYTASPDELSVIRGMSEAEAAATRTSEIYDINPSPDPVAMDPVVGFILIMGGIVLLFPIVMLLVTSTQLGSAQREKRYAAIRLVGATQGQITRIMALESIMATLVGVILGTLLYVLIRIPMAQFYYEGERFWPSDIAVSPLQYVNFILMTVLLSLGATWWAMRRSRTSPLGVTQDQKRMKAPRFWRLLPLLSGLLIYVFIATPFGQSWFRDAIAVDSSPLLVLILGVVLIMTGLILAGSWITAKIASFAARHTRKAQVLIASKRIASHSPQVFRSVSGVVLALFAGSFYLTSVSGVDDLDAQAINNNGYSVIKENHALAMASPLPDDFQQTLESTQYIRSVAPIYPTDEAYVVRCDVVAVYTTLSCPSNANSDDYTRINFEQSIGQTLSIEDEAPLTSTKDYLVQLDDNESIDKLRTLVAASITESGEPGFVVSGTYAKIAISDPLVKELASLAYVGMAVTLLIAIASLIISTVGGLLERKRSLITLRLGGMTIGQMKQLVMIESLIPLVAVSLLAAGIGVWVGYVFINIVSSSADPALSWLYFLVVGSALGLASLAIYLILPVLGRLTSYEENRTE